MALQTHGRDTVSQDAWCELIRRRCGLTFRATQIPAVIECIDQQVRTHGGSARTYYEQLSQAADGSGEWLVLIEQLVNHETSFFRHPQSFDVLASHLLPELRANGGHRRLNLLSAGCSTGQEAYSMAMVAHDYDAKLDFSVWGCDISRQAIEAARRARFGRRAIAFIPDAFRERFLTACDDQTGDFEVVDELRRRVRFTAVNLFAAETGISLSYDVIFCHNVLIYMSPAAISQIVAQLAARLVPGGYLLLGPGEGPTERPSQLEPVVIKGVRMFRRRGHTQGEARQ